MSVDSLHYLHGLNLAGGTFLSQLEDTTPASVTQMLTGYAAGHPQPLFQAVASQKPEIAFTTPQLATLLAATGIFGTALEGNTDLYYKAGVRGGYRVAAASEAHQRFRAVRSFLYPTRISVSHQQVAQASCRIKLLYDGSNSPLVALGSLALAGTPTAAEQYTLGPVEVNGVTFDGEQSLELDFSPQIDEVGDQGDIWDSWCSGATINPTLTFRSTKLETWATYGLVGSAITSLRFWLKRKQPDAANYADGSSQHIRFVLNGGGVLVPQQTSAGGNRFAETGVMIAPRSTDSTVNVFTIATAVAIDNA
jgi:hypothetical protein